MKLFVRLLVLAVVAAAFAAVWLWLQRQARQDTPPPPAPLAVGVMPVIVSNLETVVATTGNIEAWQEADIGAQVADNVRAMLVQEGDVVTAGHVVAVLDDEQARALYEAAVAARKSGEAEVRLAETAHTNAAVQFARTVNLFDENVVGRQAYDDAETAMLLALGRLDVARAQLRRVLAAEDELLIRLRRYQVAAPFEGVVAKRYVDPGTFAAAGAPLVRLVQIDPLKVLVDIPEVHAKAVAPGLPVRVRVEAVPGFHQGRVARLYPTLDARWRTRTVEIECPNGQALLRPGMFARVEVITGAEPQVLVPESAVLRLPGSGLNYLFITQTGVAVRVDVELVRTMGAWAVVRGPLAPGDLAIVKGSTLVQGGRRVAPQPAEMLP